MDLADEVWESFQDAVNDYVNQHGGSSTLPSERNQGVRPDWDKVKKYFQGEIEINEIKNDC